MPRDEIVRRLKRMTGEKHVRRPDEITRVQVAQWLGVDMRLLRMHCAGVVINDTWQIVYSQFFDLLDRGCLKLVREGRSKRLERVPPPPVPPKKKLMPHVDFVSGELKFD